MSFKLLLVGDVHAVPEELDDCVALEELVVRLAYEFGATVVFLGDQYHCHNVVRLEVMAFWRSFFKRLRALHGAETTDYCLVGNHDYAGEGSTIHSLMAHEGQITVVDRPMAISSGVVLVPYVSDREAFPSAVNALPAKTVICHQTFAGSKYENGFYAEDGVNPDLLDAKHIISGHIHAPQIFEHATPAGEFGEVTYIGAPRWRSLTDANTERAVWLYEFDDRGEILSRRSFDTGSVCRKLIHLVEEEGAPPTAPESFAPGWDYRIDIRGSSEFIERRKKELSHPGVRIRTFKTDTAGPQVRESEGIGVAFRTYLTKYSPKYGTPAERLLEMAQRRLDV